MLARLVFTNQYNQLVLDKKIKATEKKYAANLAALRLVRFWKNQSSNLNPTKDKMAKQTPEQENQLVKAITSKAITEIDKNGLHILFEFQIKKELLQYEQKLLENFSKSLHQRSLQ